MARAPESNRNRYGNNPSAGKTDRDVEAQKALALEVLLDAWEAALEEGVAPEILASSAISAALTDMVENHGEEFVARMAEGLPARIRAGEYTLTHQPEHKTGK